jgi:hypothetical protein
MPSLNDLDYYGDWQNVSGYGNAWRPRVDAGWVPYQQGQWTNTNTYGPTWVSSEPWGYAPYHYGRWANVSNQWYWIPDGVNTTPSYAPALVAFVYPDSNQIGWVPLGPGDSYAPRYYDDNWQPHYLTRTNIAPSQLVNFGIPGAVTVVSVDAWGRPIDPRSIRRFDRQRLASVRSTLDPLTLTPLRNAVVHSAWGRGKIDLPPGITETQGHAGLCRRRGQAVEISQDPAKSMRVERLSDTARNQRFRLGRRQESQQAERQTRQLEQRQKHETRDQEGSAQSSATTSG